MSKGITFVLLLAYFCYVQCMDAPVITEQGGLDAKLAANKNVLVLFTRLAPKCPECDIAAEALEALESEYDDLVAVTLDCDELTRECLKYELDHLPEVVLFYEEIGIYQYPQPYIYLEALESFVEKHMAPKTVEVESQEELDKLVGENKIAIVGFFESGENSKVRGSFRRTAGVLFTEYIFIEVLSEDEGSDILTNNDASFDSIKMFKHVGSEVSQVFFEETTITRRRITNWIDENVPWIVREIDGEAVFSSTKDSFRELPILTLYIDYENEESKTELVNALEVVAESFRKKITFTYMNGNNENYKSIFVRWGFAEGKLPVMMLVNSLSKEVYTFEGDEINAVEIGNFCNEFLERNLKPHVIKQLAPENDEGDVKVVVHDTWRSVVFDSQNDVVVFFYLPEDVCSHCVKFLAEYEKVASELKNYPDLVFTKIDMNANAQVPGIRVSNFPTILIYPKSNKFHEISFNGPRDNESVKTWILSNLSEKHHRAADELGDII